MFFQGTSALLSLYCIYCNYSGLGNKQLYLLQIVYGFVLTFPPIKRFHSRLGKNKSVILQLGLFFLFKNRRERQLRRAVPVSLYLWWQESKTEGPRAPVLSGSEAQLSVGREERWRSRWSDRSDKVYNCVVGDHRGMVATPGALTAWLSG